MRLHTLKKNFFTKALGQWGKLGDWNHLKTNEEDKTAPGNQEVKDFSPRTVV